MRCLFTAFEEIDYLGARVYVEEMPLDGIAGVLSLELCGRGDAIALWDAGDDSPFLRQVTQALEGAGLVRDQGYHVIGRIPVFGSDHRAFAAAGLSAYGFTLVPVAHADALRRFVLDPVRSTLRALFDRPPPFDTYQTSADALPTLSPRRWSSPFARWPPSCAACDEDVRNPTRGRTVTLPDEDARPYTAARPGPRITIYRSELDGSG